MKTILITGVSSGIGYCTAKELIHHSYRVIGTVRKQSDADRLVTEFGDSFHPLFRRKECHRAGYSILVP